MSQLQIEGKQILDQYNFSIAKLNQVSLSKNFLQNKQTNKTNKQTKQTKQTKKKKKKRIELIFALILIWCVKCKSNFHSYFYLMCEVQI